MLSIFLLLAACASVSTAGGLDHCSRGPGYWCHSMREAEECKAVAYCREKVWPKQDAAVSALTETDIECDVCKFALQEVKKVLVDNETQQTIKSLLVEVCDLIPLPAVKEACLIIADEIPQTMQVVGEIMEPAGDCAVMGLCTQTQTQTQTQTAVADAGSSVVCEGCKGLVNTFVEILTSENYVNLYKKWLKAICHLFPKTEEEMCDDYVDAYLEEIVEFIKTVVNAEEICELMHLCEADVTAAKGFLEKAAAVRGECELDGPEGCICHMCTYTLGEVKSVLGDKETQEKIIFDLEVFCNRLPFLPARKWCGYGVDAVTKLFTKSQTIADKIDPLADCQSIHMCS